MPPDSEIRILHCAHMPRCRARVDKRFRAYSTLQYCTAGAVDLHYGPLHHRIEPGWLWPAYPGPRIRFHPAAGSEWWEHRYVAVAGAGVERWRAAGLWPQAPQPAPRDHPCSDTFDRLLALAKRGDAWGERRAIHLLEDILLALAEERGDQTEDQPWLRTARQRLERPGLGGGIAQTAAELGMAPATFRRRFRAATGMSPREYAMAARLERARDRLLTGDEPVGAIADALGYRDAFLLSRQFKARFGLSPVEYRASRLI